ncbi:hypothetical protein [Streptomyces sp. NPDC058623]|uniref:hypothetical protein n=1 Tax=Streptomyces sp. NPDC058623 TaxID=3346563 RepID=UPI003651B3C0
MTNAAEHRPGQLDRARQFYPVHPRQVEALVSAYETVLGAEQDSAGRLIEVARRTNTPVPRALLDASAHQALVQELKWVSAGQVRAPSRPVP